MIASLQEEIAEIEHLKAGKFWRENGEKSPGFLKRMVATRSNERGIPALFDPDLQQVVSNTEDMQQVMVSFYKRLYTPDPVNDSAVEQLLTNWNSLPLNDDQRMQLTRPFTWDEISKASR
jgi:hypothetical protein